MNTWTEDGNKKLEMENIVKPVKLEPKPNYQNVESMG